MLKGKSNYSLSIGYGNVYEVILTENPYGKSIPDTLSLVFVVGNGLENKLQQKQEQTFTFSKEKTTVPYRHMPGTGFVDNKMTLWKLTNIE